MPAAEEEALSVLGECEPVMDDTSQDSVDESRILSQSIELALSCTGFSQVSGFVLSRMSEEGLATQMVCCVWRC